jgi:starch synthase (maltosyl-transferring)
LLILTVPPGGPIDAIAPRDGFDHVLLEESRLFGGDPEAAIGAARRAGLKPLLDLELDAFPADHPLVDQAREAFTLRRQRAARGPIDPRRPAPAAGEARARLRDPAAAAAVLPQVEARLAALIEAGAAGFRIRRPDALAAQDFARLAAALREMAPELVLIAHTPGVPRDAAAGLQGFDAFVSSFAYWDMKARWLAEEYEALRMTAPLLAEVGEAPSDLAALRRRLLLAAATSDGLIVPAQAAAQAGKALGEAAELSRGLAGHRGALRLIAAPRAVSAILRADAPDLRAASEAVLVLVNRSTEAPALPHEADILAAAGADFQPFRRRKGSLPAFAPLAEAEVRVLAARRARPIATARKPGKAREAEAAAAGPRLVIERVEPQVDGGAFPAKRCVGEVLTVEANFFGDGHEQLAAELRWRARDEKEWRSARMEELGNDRWRACFALERLGRYEYLVEGWLDRFGGFRRDFRKKLDAGVAQKVDFLEGRQLIEAARKRTRSDLGLRLEAFLSRLDAAEDEAAAAALLLDPELGLVMDELDERPFAIRSEPRLVDAERLAARFSSWYELFPRSQTDDPARHGTFDDVIARLPAIRDMGFDTLYFPPIHPIGRTHRKGPNNSLTAGPDDPGSPYAIGSEEGGHDALHPELGTIEDFRRLVAAARDHGLELALDFAIQCSPDHPWLKQHPGWFDWRPDGTIKYAENPPKKYQDIVNVDFYARDAVPGLWLALRDVVLFWVGEGVKTFRVDNPHTKPFPFWQWMIGEVRALHPDVIFLSEAFTRPKVMYRLAKIGFSQSYTYFTWRNEKRELTEYLTELTQEAPRDFFRPHFFVNTPDINPTFLHTSGRAGFRIRAALAATLSGLFGVYSGFELCEAEPVPGKEEYWDSEKYVVKPRDWQAPGNIIEDITLLNRLRRAFPALQTHLNLRFYTAHNERILYYGKPSPDGAEMILVAVSLDPHDAQEAEFEIPLWEWKLGDHGTLDVEDLVGDARFTWQGKMQRMRLTPDQPYAIWRVAPAGGAA